MDNTVFVKIRYRHRIYFLCRHSIYMCIRGLRRAGIVGTDKSGLECTVPGAGLGVGKNLNPGSGQGLNFKPPGVGLRAGQRFQTTAGTRTLS